MGYYKANAKESADNISSSSSTIDTLCTYIDELAEYLKNDENSFAQEYINNYNEIIVTLLNLKNDIENYANDIINAGNKVEIEIENEKTQQILQGGE